MMKTFTTTIVAAVLLPALGWTADWPNYQGNNDRTGVTSETLTLPLSLAWSFQANQPPAPSYRGGQLPFTGKESGLAEPLAHDYAYHPVIANGRVYFSSSTEEGVFCLDATTGAQQWVFHAAGAVRQPPTLANGNLYFGAEDGQVYCLNATNGVLNWQFAATITNYHCIGDGRIISGWPVRGGVIVTNGAAYFASGLFAPQGAYLYKVDAAAGTNLWSKQVPFSPNGQLLVETDRVWVPMGRASPFEIRLSDQALLMNNGGTFTTPLGADFKRTSGASRVFKVDNLVAWGPDEGEYLNFRISTNDSPSVAGSDKAMPTGIFDILRGRAALANNDKFVLVRTNQMFAVNISDFRTAVVDRVAEIIADPTGTYPNLIPDMSSFYWATVYPKGEDPFFLNRLTNSPAWMVSLPAADNYQAAILAGDTIFLGGTNIVAAYALATGNNLWTATVAGQVFGLAAANSALYVSTDRGNLYCFRNGATNPLTNAPSFTNPYPDDPIYADAASTAIAQAGRTKGYCLVLGVGQGQLAYEIAQRSDFFIVALDKDAAKVATARAKLTQAGLYGRRVVVYHEPDNQPNYADYFANLIVSDDALTTGTLPYAPARILRMLQPGTGVIAVGNATHPLDLSAWSGEQLGGWQTVTGSSSVGWQVARRGARPRAGTWPSAKGPGNTMCSGDGLVSTNLQVQWVGGPFSNDTVDRHAVAQPPLFKDGILYRSGKLNTLQAIDAYNGTSLWKITLPGSLRMLASHNACPVLCVGNDSVFGVTSNECWQINRLTGDRVGTFTNECLPGHDWGYLGTIGDTVIGTSQSTNADASASAGLGQVDAHLVSWSSQPSISKNLFAIDVVSTTRRWTYTGGAILNSTITLSADTVFFVESRNQAGLTNTTGLIEMASFIQSNATGGAQIVALNLADGSVRWTNSITRNVTEPYQWLMYLSHAENTLLATRSYYRNVSGINWRTYDFEAFDPATGTSRWNNLFTASKSGEYYGLNYGKNTLGTCPVVTDGKFYMLVNFYGTTAGDTTKKALSIFDLGTGDCLLTNRLAGNHDKGCTPPTASKTALYFRDFTHSVFGLASQQTKSMTSATRPGCWPSMLPVGGLMLMPEASAGCSCRFAYQMSVALAPVFPNGGPPNVAPVANAQTIGTAVNTAKACQLTGSDGDNDTLSYALVTPPAHGTVTGFNPATGALTYTPVHGSTNTDTFTFSATDGFTNSTAATVTLTVTVTDSDSDGIPDAWEDAHGLNKNVNDAGLDPDGDGLTNLQEYLADTDPHTATSRLATVQTQRLPNGKFVVTWNAVAGIRYRVQYSNGFTNGAMNFTDLIRPLAAELATTTGPMTFTDDFTQTGPPGNARYYRVRLEQQ